MKTFLHVALLFLLHHVLVQQSQAQDPSQLSCLALDPSPALQPYVDALPVMPMINLASTKSSKPLVIGAYKITQKFHRDLNASTVYGFGRTAGEAATPGPTLIAKSGEKSYVRWDNNITDANHIFVVDPTLEKAEPKSGIPLVVHLHGGVTESEYDGNPDCWFTNGGEKGPNFTTNIFQYANAQPPTMLWYHDHSFGYTRLTVPAGLAGLYVVYSSKDDPSWLPKALREDTKNKGNIHHMIIQDKQFFANGTINYPTIGFNRAAHPNWCVDYFGDVTIVNGKIWPYLNVTRGVHRFRVVNGANSRVFILTMSSNLTSFLKIGTDGGYLNIPVRKTQLRLAPSERADFLIDFSVMKAGDSVTVNNIADAPFPQGTPPKNSSVLMFSIGSKKGTMVPNIPATLPPNGTITDTIFQTTGFNLSAVDLTTIPRRQFVMDQARDAQGGTTTLYADAPKTYRSPATEIVPVYTDEIWEFVNNIAPISHPMHIHLINFFVMDQQQFNDTRFVRGDCMINISYPNPQSCFTQAPQLPDEDHMGWKDSAIVRPLAVTRFYVPFRPRDRKTFPFDATKAPGYVWHCHILEHEDNEMMRPLLFVNSNKTST